MNYIYEIYEIGFYVLLVMALVGLVVLIIGAIKGSSEQIKGGIITILAAVIVGICGYIMYSKTEDNLNYYYERRLQDYYENQE